MGAAPCLIMHAMVGILRNYNSMDHNGSHEIYINFKSQVVNNPGNQYCLSAPL